MTCLNVHLFGNDESNRTCNLQRNSLALQSCEQVIVCWKPGYMEQREIKPSDSAVTIVHQFHYRDSQFWFLRFGLSRDQRHLAVGNQLGKTFVWDIDVADPASSK